MSVRKCIYQDGKQTNTQPQDMQVGTTQTKKSEFLICIWNKSHMIFCMMQQTRTGFFSLNVCQISYL